MNRSPMKTMGFFTDTSVCIGCKACEVACKQWNRLPDDGFEFTGMSYDNTVSLGANTWRHVAFVEKPGAWLMMSDVCKHCERAGCLEACPTGAIVRTEFGSVFVQPDVCNGCGYCVVACPFGVIARGGDGRAWKCTLCYDRLKDDLEPACAKACPTASIQFGPLDELKARAERRLAEVEGASLYGLDQPGTDGLHAFFLLLDRPEVYNLPPDPVAPGHSLRSSWTSAALAVLGMVAAAIAVARG